MNWSELQNKVFNITNEDNEKLKDYVLITRNNLENLEIGMHIKYIKKSYDLETNEIKENVLNGGFLLDVLKGDKIATMELLLKSNIVWRLKFLKYDIYGKSKSKFNTQDNVKNNLKEIFKDVIEEKKKEYDVKLNDKLKDIKKSKSKYKIDLV